MPVTWSTLMDLLAHEFSRLRRMPVINFGFFAQPALDPHELRAEELGHSLRVDGIVRDFARTRRWPALDERAKYFLRERIRFAFEYAGIASIAVRRPITIATRAHVIAHERRLLEWMLIDVWRSSGVINWLEPIVLMAENEGLARVSPEQHATSE
jgi:hypothetical protein